MPKRIAVILGLVFLVLFGVFMVMGWMQVRAEVPSVPVDEMTDTPTDVDAQPTGPGQWPFILAAVSFAAAAFAFLYAALASPRIGAVRPARED